MILVFGCTAAQALAQASGNSTAPAAPAPGNTTAAPAFTTSPRSATTTAKPAPPDPKAPQSWLWEYLLAGYSEKDYRAAVDAMFADYERRLGKKLEPGAHRRAGLKISTSTLGLTTPKALVRAVIGALEARGFKPEELYIVDQRESHLREAGYLSVSGTDAANTFDGVPVLFLESGKYYDPKSEANYDDPLAPPDWPSQQHIQAQYEWKFTPSDRLSLLPVLLFKDTDFWINLPVGMDRAELGLMGTLVNVSLGFASNTQRFFETERSGQMAIVNLIVNAPELRAGWVFSILSLEQYQYIGGPRFDAAATNTEPVLLMSPNPVVLDSILFNRFNSARRRQNFPLLDRPSYLDFASQPQLGLGSYAPDRIYLVRLPAAK